MHNIENINVAQEVYAAIASQLGLSAAEVAACIGSIESLGADSLDIVEIVMEIEEALQVEISDNEVDATYEGDTLPTVPALVALSERAHTHYHRRG